MASRPLLALLLMLGMVTAAEAADPKAAGRVAALVATGQRPDAATTAQLVGAGAVLIDVRSEEEWQEGHIKAARLIPWQSLGATSAGLPADKNAPIVTYCASGARAQVAVLKLRGLGYTRVVALEGGFADLEAAGMKVEK